MNNMSSIALAVCLSFGLVACGGGGGNGGGASNAQPIPQDNTPISFLTEVKTLEETNILNALNAQTDTYIGIEMSRSIVENSAETNGNKKFIGLKKSYVSYAGLLLNKEKTTEDVKYLIDAQSPVSDEKLIVDATYLGNLTITNLDQSKPNEVLITNNAPVSFRVENKYISGEAKNIHLIFNKAPITKYGETIGFKGKIKQGSETGSYEGVFAGPQANELVGSVEIKNKAKGAFWAEKKEIPTP